MGLLKLVEKMDKGREIKKDKYPVLTKEQEDALWAGYYHYLKTRECMYARDSSEQMTYEWVYWYMHDIKVTTDPERQSQEEYDAYMANWQRMFEAVGGKWVDYPRYFNKKKVFGLLKNIQDHRKEVANGTATSWSMAAVMIHRPKQK